MAFVRKIKASLVRQDSSDYIGEETYIFYDIETACLRIYDGTPGGKPVCVEGVGSGDEDNIRAFIGKDTVGVEFPNYSSTEIITQNSNLETAIGDLDGITGDLVEQDLALKGTNISGPYVVDSIPAADASQIKWLVQMRETATPGNVKGFEFHVLVNGSNVEHATYAVLSSGNKILGATAYVQVVGSNVEFFLNANNNFDYVVKRVGFTAF